MKTTIELTCREPIAQSVRRLNDHIQNYGDVYYQGTFGCPSRIVQVKRTKGELFGKVLSSGKWIPMGP